MKKLVLITILTAAVAAAASAQVRRRPAAAPAPTPVPVKPVAKAAGPTEFEKGAVVGRTYTNKKFGFEIVFPDTWLIPDDDFEAYMKKQGFDLSLKAPDSLTPTGKASVNAALKKVTILLTAYRSMPGTADNAIMRVSVEDLALNPQIKDAVDYFDAIRASYKTMKLPADFKYSETQAEKLGVRQFAYLDAESTAGKKRMYAVVRDGFAVMFTLSYRSETDLVTMRRVLEEGNFDIK